MGLSKQDLENTINNYRNRYLEYGYSPKTLGWDKGKQDIRFEILTSFFNCQNSNILDIGCGFGDLNKTLIQHYGDNYCYFGIDLVEDLIAQAKKIYSKENVQFLIGNFLEKKIDSNIDIVFASGIFNESLEYTNNYIFIEEVMKKSFDIAAKGLAFDFLSDKVDYKKAHTFHSSPEKILSLAYKLSRNVIIRNDYFPFEFSLCIYKDESFDVKDTVFKQFKKNN
jgi:SAM-dependent methyltransferase